VMEIFVQYQHFVVRHILGGWRVCTFRNWDDSMRTAFGLMYAV
jgi:hypothetical protein